MAKWIVLLGQAKESPNIDGGGIFGLKDKVKGGDLCNPYHNSVKVSGNNRETQE